MRTARPNDVIYFQPIGNRFNGSGVCLFATIQNPVEVTHACENITFARFATRAVINTKTMRTLVQVLHLPTIEEHGVYRLSYMVVQI